MSRHREVHNVDCNDPPEFEACGLSDNREDAIEKQRGALRRRPYELLSPLGQVRNTLGDQRHSGCSDEAIREALWECFFDVDKSVVWLLGLSYSLHPSCVH